MIDPVEPRMHADAEGVVHIGCAGWSLPGAVRDRFDAAESQLARYATRFNAVEINSSFYRPHRRQTYERWSSSTPATFAFSVKVPKTVTHESRLASAALPLFEAFLDEAQGLGAKLRWLLVQLPPSLAFEARLVDRFASRMRRRFDGAVAVEPRHASWFTPEADALLASFEFARVLADPVRHDPGVAPGGWHETIYLRLHGSPRVYWSRYDDALLAALALRLREAASAARHCWCIFDNTAGGAAVGDALRLKAALEQPPNPALS